MISKKAYMRMMAIGLNKRASLNKVAAGEVAENKKPATNPAPVQPLIRSSWLLERLPASKGSIPKIVASWYTNNLQKARKAPIPKDNNSKYKPVLGSILPPDHEMQLKQRSRFIYNTLPQAERRKRSFQSEEAKYQNIRNWKNQLSDQDWSYLYNNVNASSLPMLYSGNLEAMDNVMDIIDTKGSPEVKQLLKPFQGKPTQELSNDPQFQYFLNSLHANNKGAKSNRSNQVV